MTLLVINPGSTSTKLSLYRDESVLWEENVFHDAPELNRFPHVNDQMAFREKVILDLLAKHGSTLADVDVFVGRGGSAHTQKGGVTRIDSLLFADTQRGVGGSEHPAKLGVMLAYVLAEKTGKQAYTLNPTNVDEMTDVARLTGIKGVYRNAQFHVLNQKATAQVHAEKKLHRRYEDCNFIVAHIDGGITVNAHDHGQMVDGNVGAGGDSPFTPTRIGSVPILPLLDYIESTSLAHVRRMCSSSGGFVDLFGTANADTIHHLVDQGDPKACLVWDALIYQIAKMIGEMATVLCGQVDGILLTGGFMRFSDLVEGLERRCGWIAPITVYPGEMEQDAMALSVLRALRGEAPILTYTGKPVWNGFAGMDL